MLDVKQINVSYGNIHAVRDVSLNVERGEIVTIIGANGAGKSTILKTLVGLLRSTTGDILFEGKSISTLAPAAIVSHGIALVPEGRRIFPRLSTLDNLALGGYGHSKREITEGLSRVFEMFPRLAERASGNALGVLDLQSALVVNLAPLLVNQIFQTILDINADGTTLLLVEQNAHLALAIADRAYVLETGAIVLADKAEVLAQDEQVRHAYLGE